MNRINRENQLFQLILARIKETIREPGVIFWGMIFPMLMSLGLGIAFMNKTDIFRRVGVIIHNQDTISTGDSTHVLQSFLQHQTEKINNPKDRFPAYKFTIRDEKLGNSIFLFQEMRWDEAMVLLKRGNMSIVLNEQKGQIGYHFDPLNPDAQLSYLKLSGVFGKKGNPVAENRTNIQPLTVRGTRYIDFLIPGLIAMGVMMSTMWGISYDIIEKRSKKLLRRMVATPMKKYNFLFALMTVRLVMNFLEAALLFIFSAIVFGISIQGNIGALFLIFMAGSIAFTGIATFISSHTSKTEIGNGFINAVVMPMMVLSGVFFSYHNFPDWTIPFIQPLPATILADGLRSIFIEGAGFAEITVPSLILITTGVVFFTAGLKIFKWH
ncbi:MAG: ABC transporter permease [Bacteroidetes bacterium]|nr:ABC transporter permease [Bacteroidota bacterium]